MKKVIRKVILPFVIVILVIGSESLTAQPLPNENGNGTNTGNTLVGGGAPIGGGLLLMLLMGGIYGMDRASRKSSKREE